MATAKTTFFSLLNTPKTIPSETGTEYETTYIEKTDELGRKTLHQTGKTNRYEKIQAAYPGTQIYNILDRYYKGDTEALEQTASTFADVTTAPKSLIEAYQRIEDIEHQFMNLPVDLRAEFNHNSTEYIASMATGNGIQIIQRYAEKSAEREHTATAAATDQARARAERDKAEREASSE